MSLLVICEILGLFLNTLTVDDKYFHHYRENFEQPVQKELYQKPLFF